MTLMKKQENDIGSSIAAVRIVPLPANKDIDDRQKRNGQGIKR